jgi:hypothetical protein
MTPAAWARTVEDFLAGARDAIVLDGGAAVFDLAQAKYSISGERNKYLLHDTCCTISRRKSRGWLWALTSGGGMECLSEAAARHGAENRPQVPGLRLIYFSGHAPSKRRTSTNWAR